MPERASRTQLPKAKKRARRQAPETETVQPSKSYRRRSKGPQEAAPAAAGGAAVRSDHTPEESAGAADRASDGSAEQVTDAHEEASEGGHPETDKHRAGHGATGDDIERDMEEVIATGEQCAAAAVSFHDIESDMENVSAASDSRVCPRRASGISASTRAAIDSVETRATNILEHDVMLDEAVITSIMAEIPFDDLTSHRAVNGLNTKGFCLGLIRSGAFVEMASNTKRFPKLCNLLQKYIANDMPWFTYTGIQLNAFKSESEQIVQYGHCDVHDADGKDQAIRGFGKYSGGEVFVADPPELEWTVPKRYWGGLRAHIPHCTPTTMLKEPYKPGMKVNGKLIDVSKDWALFSGHRYHCPQPARGTRYTLVYFTCSVHLKNKAGLTPSKLMRYMEGGWPIAALPTDIIINQWGPLEADHLAIVGHDTDGED